MSSKYIQTCLALILIVAAWGLVPAVQPAAQDNPASPFEQAITQELERTARGRGPAAEEAQAILEFYRARGFTPFWFEGDDLNDRADALFATLSRAGGHGLKPEWYGMPALAQRPRSARGEQVPGAELALTRAFVRYGGDVRSGRIRNPRNVRGMRTPTERPAPSLILAGARAARDFEAHLDSLPPDERRYRQLVQALSRYREIADKGGWPSVPQGETLEVGMTDPRVAPLRGRLRITGDLAGEAAERPAFFDARLGTAVRRFQDRMGLVVDGRVGDETLAALNVPVSARIAQIAINLERRRWRAELLEDRYIWVNAAAQEAKLVENGRTMFETRIIVGTTRLQTPEFSARLTYIQLNPYWNVPRSIAVNEMLPRIKRDPGYLTRNHYLLLRAAGQNDTAVNPQAVDWSQINRSNFPFAIRQRPGSWNALGRLILRFPNPFNVYMHDTPSCHLFERPVRTFSHGCIRTENPHILAALILRHQTDEWTEERILEATAGETGPTIQIDIDRPPYVHVTYITAWADADGRVEFRRDVYSRDGRLMRALEIDR